MSAQRKIEEVAGKTLSQARALARRRGYHGEPAFIEICGALCVLRFEQPVSQPTPH